MRPPQPQQREEGVAAAPRSELDELRSRPLPRSDSFDDDDGDSPEKQQAGVDDRRGSESGREFHASQQAALRKKRKEALKRALRLFVIRGCAWYKGMYYDGANIESV